MEKKREKELRIYRRHVRLYLFFRGLLIWMFNRKYNVSCDEIEMPEGASLILANHSANYDQFFVIQAIGKNHTYFVSSENPFRNVIIRKLVVWLAGIIIHVKGYQSVSTAKNMLKQLKLGANVMIFPEGNRTFDGRTAEVLPAIAKLAKVSGANLVLLRMTGGYFSQPRWGCSKRAGQIHFSNQIISKDKLKGMSVEEIAGAINEGLYVDAYLEQEKNPVRYKGKKMCFGIESGLYQCPECKKLSTLKSDEKSVFCECGFVMIYDEFGYLLSENGDRRSITELMDAQRQFIKDKISESESEGKEIFLFEDTFVFEKLRPNKGSKKIGDIHIKAYTNHVEYECGDKKGIINRDEIDSVVIYGKNTLTCFEKGSDTGYELHGVFATNSLKYRDLFEG